MQFKGLSNQSNTATRKCSDSKGFLTSLTQQQGNVRIWFLTYYEPCVPPVTRQTPPVDFASCTGRIHDFYRTYTGRVHIIYAEYYYLSANLGASASGFGITRKPRGKGVREEETFEPGRNTNG